MNCCFFQPLIFDASATQTFISGVVFSGMGFKQIVSSCQLKSLIKIKVKLKRGGALVQNLFSICDKRISLKF